MTLTDNSLSNLVYTTSDIPNSSTNLSNLVYSNSDIPNSSTNLDSLYCSHLWTDSNLRNAIITAPLKDNKMIKYCYTCKGKIRKYEIKPPINRFLPNNYSTPNGKKMTEIIETPATLDDNDFQRELETTNVEIKQYIPSISHRVDSSFRQKFTSYEMRPNKPNRRRLRKSLKGIGCVLSLALTDSPVKKRTKIQACSISVMILAIIAISFVLVNFTPNLTQAFNPLNITVVPTKILDINETSTIPEYTDLKLVTEHNITEYITTTEDLNEYTSENNLLISKIISKIRKNIKTYPKDSNKNRDIAKPKDIINRDLSQKFCSCQKDEICMLDENSGTSICRQSADVDDPTGCGGLCALETEACHLVDKGLGVRVCRLLTLLTCSPHEWRCRNGLCVSARSRCDGTIQCYDRSDELYCDCDLTKQFRCGHSISCFSNMKLCDGVIDCWDGYDEVNCTTECPEDKFTCTDGQCILSSRFCDGLADCADRSDEPSGCDGDCGAHEIRCKNNRCVPHAALCDGHDNCGDASDELNCSV